MNNNFEEIKNFINNVDHAFNSIDVTNHINIKLNKDYKPSVIRRLMKTELNLIFKKVKPRPNNVNFDILKVSRQLFSEKYPQIISSDTLVINLDETSLINKLRFPIHGVKRELQTKQIIHRLLDL